MNDFVNDVSLPAVDMEQELDVFWREQIAAMSCSVDADDVPQTRFFRETCLVLCQLFSAFSVTNTKQLFQELKGFDIDEVRNRISVEDDDPSFGFLMVLLLNPGSLFQCDFFSHDLPGLLFALTTDIHSDDFYAERTVDA